MNKFYTPLNYHILWVHKNAYQYSYIINVVCFFCIKINIKIHKDMFCLFVFTNPLPCVGAVRGMSSGRGFMSSRHGARTPNWAGTWAHARTRTPTLSTLRHLDLGSSTDIGQSHTHLRIVSSGVSITSNILNCNLNMLCKLYVFTVFAGD